MALTNISCLLYVAAPQVAALAAYFRALSSPWQSQLSSPSNVKKLIQLFTRRFAVHHHPVATEDMRPVIWNGQVGEHSCLSEYAAKGKEDWVNVCPTIKDDLADELPNPGESVGSCSPGQTGSSAKRRRQSAGDGGGSCPHVPGSSGPGKTIDWEEGPSAPECAADDHCGGELCKGYYVIRTRRSLTHRTTTTPRTLRTLMASRHHLSKNRSPHPQRPARPRRRPPIPPLTPWSCALVAQSRHRGSVSIQASGTLFISKVGALQT